VPTGAPRDRYEPLPSLPEIPAFLLRRLGSRGRRTAAAVAGLVVAGLAAFAVFGLPAVQETKQERAAAEQAAIDASRAREIARIRADQYVVRGTGTPSRGLEGAAAIAARQALAADLSEAVEEDARARVLAGELQQGILRAECERYPRGARGEDPATDLSSRTGRYSCLAVTAVAPRTETQESSSIGYPYRALVDFPTGRMAYCKISGRPGEGALRDVTVRVPAACGGGA
jgi:hypothetical protein